MSLDSNIGNIAHAADLVTVLHGIKYYNVHYLFTNSDLNKTVTYRNNVGFKFYEPPSADVPHFLYWQVDKDRISANQECVDGLTSNISAFLHNIDICSALITPNIPSNLVETEYLSDLSVNGRLFGNTLCAINATKTLDLSTFRCTWLSNYDIQYSSTYPSIMLNLSCQHPGFRFDSWKVCCDANPYAYNNDSFSLCDVFEVTSNVLVYPNYIKLVYLVGSIGSGFGQINGLLEVYDKNQFISLSAVPSAHYHFSRWDGSIVDPATSMLCVISAVLSDDANRVSAYFDKDIYSMKLYAVGNNGEKVNCNVELSVQAIDNSAKIGLYISADYEYGTNILIRALNDNTGKYKFVNWSDGILTNNRIMTVSESKQLSALFAKSGVIKLNIIVCPENAGYVRQTNSNGLYYYGNSTMLYAFETDVEYRFDHWSNGISTTYLTLHNLHNTTNLSAIFVDKMQIKTGTGNMIGTYVDGVLEDIVYQK